MGIREEVYFEGGPHIGDLIINILLGFTVICLPLTVGAIVRALWLRYRITNRRVSVTGGWLGRDRTDIIYTDVVKAVKVPRGLGLWGDMVLTTKNGTRLELKAVPRFREVYDYINEKVMARTGQSIAETR
jgi:nitrogen fixation protein